MNKELELSKSIMQIFWSPTEARNAIKEILKTSQEDPNYFPWEVQGLGMLRMYIDVNRAWRLHIWNHNLRVHNITDIHTHPWNFESHIIFGSITNTLFSEHEGDTHIRRKIVPGMGTELEEEPVELKLLSTSRYEEKSVYYQRFDEIHKTQWGPGGTTTLIVRSGRRPVDEANTYRLKEYEWVSAKPRKATVKEILESTQMALDLS